MAELFAPEFVNRDTQVNNFKQILSGDMERWLIIIRGEKNIGKTTLLEQLRHMARQSPISWRDFQDPKTVPKFRTLLEDTIRDLGNENFRNTWAELRSIYEKKRDTVRVSGEVFHEPGVDKARLRMMMGDYLNKNDLKNISFDLDVDDENLGELKDDIIRGLISQMIRKGRLEILLNRLKAERPGVNWREVISGPPEDSGLSVADRLKKFDVDPLEQELNQDDIWLTFVTELALLSNNQLIVLSYDSFEQANLEVQKWLNKILSDLAHGRIKNVIVLLAGENKYPVTRTMIPFTLNFKLKYFEYETVREFWVERQGLPTADVAGVWEKTAGHPNELADLAVEAGGTNFRTKTISL